MYKVRQLKKSGVALTGRGKSTKFKLLAEYLAKFESFDEMLPHLAKLTRKVNRAIFIEELGRELEPGVTFDDIMAVAETRGGEVLGWVHVGVLCTGYSHKNKSMGMAMVESCDNYKLQHFYTPGFAWFMDIATVKDFFDRWGRLPESDKEIIDCFRLVYKARLEKNKKTSQCNRIIGGGHIQMTTVYANKKFTVKNMGPILETKGKKRNLKICPIVDKK